MLIPVYKLFRVSTVGYVLFALLYRQNKNNII